MQIVHDNSKISSMARRILPLTAISILLVAVGTMILFCRNGALAVVPDVLVWPNLRALTPEEDRILTPFVSRVHDLIWGGGAAMLACLSFGFLAGWFLRDRLTFGGETAGNR
jgi:hypothetical protein